MKYKEMIKETGFLTSAGEELMNDNFLPIIKNILKMGETENEIRIIGSVLSNLIGKETTNIIQHNNEQRALVEFLTESIRGELKSFVNVSNNKDIQDQIKKKLRYETGGFITDPFENDPTIDDLDRKY